MNNPTSLSKKLFELQPGARWIRRRSKHYMKATNQYTQQLKQILDHDTGIKLEQLISATPEIFLKSDLNLPLKGISLCRFFNPQPHLGQKVRLINLENGEEIVEGFVSKVNSSRIDIKFLKPIVESMFLEEKIEILEIDNEKDGKNEMAAIKVDHIHCKLEFGHSYIIKRHECIKNAIDKFQKIDCQMSMHRCILGYYNNYLDEFYKSARIMTFDTLPYPREKMQRLAIEQSLRRRISLIEGPAGSGKTTLAAYIAGNISRLRRKKVLFCSTVQTTVSKLAKLIESIDGLEVVELPNAGLFLETNRQRELSVETTTNCNLDKLVDLNIFNKALKQADGIIEDRKSLIRYANRMVANGSQRYRSKSEHEILKRADVVCCNLLQSDCSQLRGINFDVLIIDDVQVATELECIIPMVRNSIKQITLISDLRRNVRLPKRNSSFNQAQELNSINIDNEGAKAYMLSRNSKYMSRQQSIEFASMPTGESSGLFERWLKIGISAVALRYQYRAHKSLTKFACNKFYRRPPRYDHETNASLEREVQKCWRDDGNCFNWLPKPKCMTALFNPKALGDNSMETLKAIVDNLVNKEGIVQSRICIIVNCRTERKFPIDGIEIGTAREFLGQERDFVILLCLEANNVVGFHESDNIAYRDELDFLSNDYALNVALTRARLGIFIIADIEESCEKCCASWLDLTEFYLKNEIVGQST